MRIWIALVALLMVACVDDSPPRTITVDSRFTDEQHSMILDIRNQWCQSVGYCPDLVTKGGNAKILCQTHEEFLRSNPAQGAIAHNHFDGDYTIFVDCEVLTTTSPYNTSGDYIHDTMLHEWGHFGIRMDLFEPGFLMSMRASLNPAVCIDLESAQLWCKEQECSHSPQSTCPSPNE